MNQYKEILNFRYGQNEYKTNKYFKDDDNNDSKRLSDGIIC
jgi:hypothetical protein